MTAPGRPPSATGAAVLGLLAAVPAAVYVLVVGVAVVLARLSGALLAWEVSPALTVGVPALLVVGLVVGARRVLRGRGWRLLAGTAVGAVALVLAAAARGGSGGGAGDALVLGYCLLPLAALVCALAPGTRGWAAGTDERGLVPPLPRS